MGNSIEGHLFCSHVRYCFSHHKTLTFLFVCLYDVADAESPQSVLIAALTSVTSDGTFSSELEGATLRRIFERYMSCPDEVIAVQVALLVQRLEEAKLARVLSPEEELMLRLSVQYPNDIGIFSPLIMNYLRLSKGQSFFIGANELHAYISGECVECMALSDNVVRAGLTPKFKDRETLCNMLVYK